MYSLRSMFGSWGHRGDIGLRILLRCPEGKRACRWSRRGLVCNCHSRRCKRWSRFYRFGNSRNSLHSWCLGLRSHWLDRYRDRRLGREAVSRGFANSCHRLWLTCYRLSRGTCKGHKIRSGGSDTQLQLCIALHRCCLADRHLYNTWCKCYHHQRTPCSLDHIFCTGNLLGNSC